MKKFPKVNDSQINANEVHEKSEPKIFFEPQYRNSSESCENFTNILSFQTFRNNPKDKKEQTISPIFIDALRKSTNKVWLIDTYLSKETAILEQILDEIIYCNDSNIDVRVFFRSTLNNQDLEDMIKRKQKLILELNISQTSIQFRYFSEFEKIHDRFAMIDNQLWHFGSDVGASNPKFNATSFGWDAKALQIDKFFKELWENGR